jgi:hypothetical protein
VPEVGDGNTAQRIEILLAVAIVQIAAFAVGKADGQRPIGVNEMV